ncbi:MAG: DUF1080 domain-containing protein [Acidobacteria bacterium]|nr:MAG: DUF1080 domain-containing protein [Acidobacteriota bacterium]
MEFIQSFHKRWVQFVLLVWLCLFSCFNLSLASQSIAPKVDENDWLRLFDGKSLQNWHVSNFGGEGEVYVEDGQVILEMGANLTGITWTGEFPQMDYEVILEAMRVEGSDFFCGMTFPVGPAPCSLITGGWGGTVVGLSSIDGRDASENETSQLMNFNAKQWYRIRLRVTAPKIEAWIDEKQVINLLTRSHKISIRPEVELSRPFGIASWRTKAALRNIKMRWIR